MPTPDGIDQRSVRVGELDAEWLLPAERRGDGRRDGGAPDTMLYLHGGGYCMGSIASHRALAARLGAAAACRVLLIDYRLAPEHPFPAALKDARAAYEWLLGQGVDASRLVAAGDSAGGGLALALLLALARDGMDLPAGAVCFSPWSDLTPTGAAVTASDVDDPLISAPDARLVADLYLQGHDPADPLVSPVFGDFRGLPPLLLQVGTRERLLDDARRVAGTARRAGVEVTLEEWAGLIHVWQFLAPLVPEACAAIRAAGHWVRGLAGATGSAARTSAA
jgi:acetyl esterase/lipase